MQAITRIESVLERVESEAVEGRFTPEQLSESLRELPGWQVNAGEKLAAISKQIPPIVRESELPAVENIGVSDRLFPGQRRIVVLGKDGFTGEDLRAVADAEVAVYEPYAAEGFTWDEYRALLLLPGSASEISTELKLSFDTVKEHLKFVRSKLGATLAENLVREAFERGLLLNPTLTEAELDQLSWFTPRLWEVAELTFQSRQKIGKALCIEDSTVKGHLQHAYQLTGTKNKAELQYLILRARSSISPEELELMRKGYPAGVAACA